MSSLVQGWLILAILSAVVSFCDLKSRTIPNSLAVAILIVSITFSNVDFDFNWIVKAFLISFFFLALYAINIWGGGDAKIAIVFLPAISESFLILYLLVIGIVGGVVAFCYLIFAYLSEKENKYQIGLPYCVPICISGVTFALASL
ncbi:prepilin peptidase [Vibrio panuliri]|uniref:prepilin peptidase n=2 Tax=Vibrio panuliri TaxID=1381081 RepID=UPI000952E73D|nr:prepilin peptidase [Vibrio panuliri]